MDDGLDYEVQTKVTFQLDFDGSGEFNMLLLPKVRQQFTQHVQKVYERDDTLPVHIPGDINLRFDGRKAALEYVFTCHDENAAEAESFSAYCVRRVREQLEEFGCKIREIDCKATEADMSWLDRLEDAVFGPKKEEPPAPQKKGKKRSGQER